MQRDAQREDKVKSQKKAGHVMTEAEIRVMQPRNAKACWPLSGPREKQRRISPRAVASNPQAMDRNQYS